VTNMAILISGRGTNMEALAGKCKSGELNANVAFVASDKADALGLNKAKAMNFKTLVLPYDRGKAIAEAALDEELRKHSVDWIVLAGFMRILSSRFVARHSERVVNIHPSLLPAFPGTQAIKDAYEYGVKVTGVTIHLVDEMVDHGPILNQAEVRILDEDSLESLEAKIHEVEHDIYWRTLKDLFAGRYLRRGRRMIIEGSR